jgi:hypothetical protein
VLRSYYDDTLSLLGKFDSLTIEEKQFYTKTAIEVFLEKYLGKRISDKIADKKNIAHLSARELRILLALVTIMCRNDSRSDDWRVKLTEWGEQKLDRLATTMGIKIIDAGGTSFEP